jgi:hypothetical protein
MTEQSDLCPELKRAYREAKAQGLPEGWTCRILEHKVKSIGPTRDNNNLLTLHFILLEWQKAPQMGSTHYRQP